MGIFKKKKVLSFYYSSINVLNIPYKNYYGDEKHQIYVFQSSALNWLFVPDKTIHKCDTSLCK